MSRPIPLCLAVMPLVLLAGCDRSRPTEVARPSADVSASRDGKSNEQSDHQDKPGTMTVVASGLTNPRGIAFGHDRALYVAEAGLGGTTSTVGKCQQVPAPVGPFRSGRTGRISRIGAAGNRTTVVDGLPSSANAMGDVVGVADVAFVGRTLYALLDAGCGHGVADVPASVIRVHNGKWSMTANLTNFVHAHPVARPEPDDFEPDGDWYSMISAGGTLFAVDANGGQLVAVRPHNGKVERVIDISASQGHIVPTAVVKGNGAFFVGNLETFPAVPGGAKIFRVTRSGHIKLAYTGLTTVLGLAVAEEEDEGEGGGLYVLESFTCPSAPLPCVPAPFAAGRGQVVRIDGDGTKHVIASGLTFPTSMRFGPDGALYVSNKGYRVPPGAGEIVRITLPH